MPVNALLNDVQYLFRARMIGVYEWGCVYCGHLNESRMRPQTFIVQCSGEWCRRKMGVGHVAWLLPSGPKTLPPDYIIPAGGLRELFPRGEISVWESGQLLAHRVGLQPEVQRLQYSSADPEGTST